MATDVDADASMSALRAKYDATTKLLAAQCDTVDRLRAEVRALRRAPEGKEPFGEYARGCSPSVAGDVASDYESKYRRAKKFVKTQVRGGADARTTTRATVRPLATTSSPPPAGRAARLPSHPETHPTPRLTRPPLPFPLLPRQAIEIAKLLERAKRAETSAEDANARARAADASIDAVRESAMTIRADYVAALEDARRAESAAVSDRDAAFAAAAADAPNSRARARPKHPPRRAPARRIVGVERDDARPRVGRRARRSRVARENRRGVPRHPSPRNAREGRARRRTRRRARRRELSRVLRGIRRRRVERRARRRQKKRRARSRRSRRRARRRA